MTGLAAKISENIRSSGPMCLAQFMDLALYCPNCGYYETEKDRIGVQGDFYTSVSAGPVFGKLIAFQIQRWVRENGFPGTTSTLQLVEAGAHHGALAADILDWLASHAPDLLERVHYWIIEPSALRQRQQAAALHRFRQRVSWSKDIPGLRAQFPEGLSGVIFSNELLDAMPVHSIRWSAAESQWMEWGVGSEGERLVWNKLPTRCSEIAYYPGFQALPNELLKVLPDGFTLEIGSASLRWWRDAANTLRQGFLMTFDYGFEWEEFLLPQRSAGTLRGFHHHQFAQDVLASPGAQDITAHVNFTALRQTGESAGLSTVAQEPQSRFLVRNAIAYWDSALPPWTPREVRNFQAISRPEGLGRAVQVLIQSRGTR
jgi:SAM-dependent MidA family methyltransferase